MLWLQVASNALQVAARALRAQPPQHAHAAHACTSWASALEAISSALVANMVVDATAQEVVGNAKVRALLLTCVAPVTIKVPCGSQMICYLVPCM